jgi:HlyD family secretion protein
LVVLRSPELDLRITQLSRELEGVAGKNVASTTDNDRRVAEIRANFETRKNQLQFEIQRLLDERARNKELTSKLRSLPAAVVQDTNDAMMLQVRAYERELAMAESSVKSQINLLQGSIGLQKSSGKAEQEAMRRELQLLQNEKDRLVIRAKSAALVGSVRSHVGEKLSPFDSILTLTPFAPTFVRGYIHEKVYNRIKQGDFVVVRSSGERRGSVRGQVVGVGSRIVEFPIHLRKMPEMIIWGREITIQIPPENSFLLGELVSISPETVVEAMIAGGKP